MDFAETFDKISKAIKEIVEKRSYLEMSVGSDEQGNIEILVVSKYPMGYIKFSAPHLGMDMFYHNIPNKMLIVFERKLEIITVKSGNLRLTIYPSQITSIYNRCDDFTIYTDYKDIPGIIEIRINTYTIEDIS